MPWDASRIVVARRTTARPTSRSRDDAVACGQPRFSPDGAQLAYIRRGASCGSTTRRRLLERARARARRAGVGAGATFVRVVARRRRARVVPQRRRLRPARDRRAGPASRRASCRRVGTAASTGAPAASCACVRARSRRRRSWCSPPNGSARRAIARGPVGGFEATGLVEPQAGHVEVGERDRARPAVATRPTRRRAASAARAACTAGRPARRSPTGTRASRLRAARLDGAAAATTAARRATARVPQALAGTLGRARRRRRRGRASATPRRRAGPTRARVALMGGSAGGLTVLLRRRAASRPRRARWSRCIPVVRSRSTSTRRRTASSRATRLRLVGPLPAAVDDVPRPLAGLPCARDPRAGAAAARHDDDTVPLAQSAAVEATCARGRRAPVERHVYEGEGHGWRKAATIADDVERSTRSCSRWVLPPELS